MIKYNLCIFSRNVRKNKTDIILERQKNLSDIIFIQEPPRALIYCIPSYTDPEGDSFYGTPNHLEWTLFIQNNLSKENFPRVILFQEQKRLSLSVKLSNNSTQPGRHRTQCILYVPVQQLN